MRVYPSIHSLEEPPHLYLGAQNKIDAELLERIVDHCHVLGFGRRADTMEMLHVEIELKLKGPIGS